MSTIAAYAVESDVSKELKKGNFKLYHQKTPPTNNVVLLEIHEDDTDEVKRIKRLVNEMRLELGNSTDLIKIEPETALFNILYTKKEVDQLVISSQGGFNLPMFLHTVLINGAKMIKLRGAQEQDTGLYTDLFSTTADNFEYVYKVFNEYADQFAKLDAGMNTFNNEMESLTNRVDELEDDVSKIVSCTCDKEWMKFMKKNFSEGLFDDEIRVNGEIDFQGNHIAGVSEIKSVDGTLYINSTTIDTGSGRIKAVNIPPDLTFRRNGILSDINMSYINAAGQIVNYNSYGKWMQPCDTEVFGSIDVDNRLRINTLNDEKTEITSTIDVGAFLEDLDYRVSEIESSGGGGGVITYIPGNAIDITHDQKINVLYDNETIGIKDNKLYAIGGGSGGEFWKLNPTRMQTLPEHKTLETYDFIMNSHNVNVRNIDADTIFVYFPNLTVDLSYDRAQFIEIKSINPDRTWYLTTKNGFMEYPMIINSKTFQEETVLKNNINEIGMLWKKQIQTKETTKNGLIATIPLFFTVYFETDFRYYDEEFWSGLPEKPLTIKIKEYNSSKEIYRTSTFLITTVFDLDTTITGSIDGSNEKIYMNCSGDPAFSKYVIYYLSGPDFSNTFSSTWTFIEYIDEITVDVLIDKIHKNEITFEYTPDRDKIINNEPVSITSTELIDNQTIIKAPNSFDYHKYGGVKDYEIRLDKIITDTKSVSGFSKITFKDFEIGGDYEGIVFTIYFGTNRFMMNNELSMKPISCYYENGKYYTDKFLKKDGFWTCEKIEVDTLCFLWDAMASLSLFEAYNIGEITIKYIPRQCILSTNNDVICNEIVAENALELYKSATPNFYNPRIIEDVVDESSKQKYYVIDFGYEEKSEEFKNLPEGFRFRFKDLVFHYDYECIKKNNAWTYTYGNLHCKASSDRFRTSDLNYSILRASNYHYLPRGPCIINNESNKIALTCLVQKILGHKDVSSMEAMWKTLWNDSRAKITKPNGFGIKRDKAITTDQEEGFRQYVFIDLDFSDLDTGFHKGSTYEIIFEIEPYIKLYFSYTCTSVASEIVESIISDFTPERDSYEVLPFEFHETVNFEHEKYGNRLRFYALPNFLVWNTEINYSTGTNSFRFLYDKDYLEVEPRPESCSALMTNKNIITDGIVVAQNLETHLHSLNQVANAGEELTTHVAYTDNILAEVISNLANINDFIRLTIITDFICLGITGLCSITKMGAAFMKGGMESALRFTEYPLIRETIRDGRTYNRIGHEAIEMEMEGTEIIMRSPSILEESAVITRNVERDISETATNINRVARENISESAVSINRDIRESMILDVGDATTIRSPNLLVEGERATMNIDELAISLGLEDSMMIDLSEASSYGFSSGSSFLGWCKKIGENIKNNFGIVFDARHFASLSSKVSDVFWAMIGMEKGITWALQLGTKIKNCITFEIMNDDKLHAEFLVDRFTWSVVDAAGIYTPHDIVGIAKYNEMSGWNDEKLITAQALLENYYSKTDIDNMLDSNTNSVQAHRHDEYVSEYTTVSFTESDINDDLWWESGISYAYNEETDEEVEAYCFRFRLANSDKIYNIPLGKIKFIFEDDTFLECDLVYGRYEFGEFPRYIHQEVEIVNGFLKYHYISYYNLLDAPKVIRIEYIGDLVFEPYATVSHTHKEYAKTKELESYVRNSYLTKNYMTREEILALDIDSLTNSRLSLKFANDFDLLFENLYMEGHFVISTGNGQTKAIFSNQHRELVIKIEDVYDGNRQILHTDGNKLIIDTPLYVKNNDAEIDLLEKITELENTISQQQTLINQLISRIEALENK